MVYLEHRQFLPPGHPLRSEWIGFPTKKAPKSFPVLKDMSFLDRANSRLKKAVTKKSKKAISRATGCKGEYALQQLSHHDRFLNTPVEPMHLIKDIVEHVVRLISGAEDSWKVRKEEKIRGRFPGSWLKGSSHQLPQAPWRLTTEEAKIANARACSIQVPIGFGWKPKALFCSNAVGMKSHSWKQLVCTYILKYCIRGLLGQQQRQTLFRFCNVLAQLCVEYVNTALLQQLELDVHHTLSLLERDFPVALHVCVFHLLHHLPFYLNRFGPVHTYWMFPFERFNSWVIRRVQNRRYPESTVVETYRLFEWANFLQMSGELPSESVVLPGQGDDDEVCNVHITEGTRYSLSSVEFANLEVLYSSDIRARLERAVTKFDRYTYKDAHNRMRALTSSSGDSRLTLSSYVYTRLHDNSQVFGRINFFFQHSLSVETYAYVKWFDKPSKELESELLFIHLDSASSLNPVVLVSTVLGPVVTAVDIDRPNILWILSD